MAVSLRTGPGRYEFGENKYKHFFDGQALLHNFTFDNGSVSYQSRWVHKAQANSLRRAAHNLLPSVQNCIFMPGGITFWGCPSVHMSGCPSVCPIHPSICLAVHPYPPSHYRDSWRTPGWFCIIPCWGGTLFCEDELDFGPHPPRVKGQWTWTTNAI